MAFTFYDSATPGDVPSGVHAAVYVNGNFAWPESEIRRMAKVIRISVSIYGYWARVARVLDVETGDASPGDAPGFVRTRRAHGHHDATIYCNRSVWPEVQSRMHANGLSCRYWIATLDGTKNVPGAWAVQYETAPGNRYDLSECYGPDDFGPNR